MNLALDEDQELLAKTATDWVTENSPVTRVRELRDKEDPDGFSRAAWKEMAELGWVGIPFSESHGGAELGMAELAVVLEALGRNLAPEPFLSTVLLVGRALQLSGNEEHAKRWLPQVVEGDAILALAYQEANSRYDLNRVSTKAEQKGAGFALSGEKVQVLDGASADALVVSARTSGEAGDADGITLFVVPRASSGLEVVRQHRVDSRHIAMVRLNGVEVGAGDVLGEVGAGGALLERVVDYATVGLCAEMLGSMLEALDRTLMYLRTREQFGVPIGSFQALKHRATELFVEVELSRSTVMAAARALDEDAPDTVKLVSLAKARCSDAALLVGHEAVQMHGGIGMTDEHDIGFYLKRARVAQITFGDAAWHRERWARLNGY